MFSEGALVAGKYRIEKQLGEGGMGLVFAARHELLAQRIALKVLRPSVAETSSAIARFVNEARAVASMENVHVARVIDVGTDNGIAFMAMELLDGSDFDEILRAEGPLPVETAVDAILAALEAIAEAHAMGIIHRDLKPSNLFRARKKDGSTIVKVLDFGISKSAETLGVKPITGSDAILGSPTYASPEQLRSAKDVDARADIWSIGVTLYELLTGALPFHGESVGALFAAILEQRPKPMRAVRASLPEGLDLVVLRCLQLAPEQRYPNVAALAQALRPWASAEGVASAERIKKALPSPAERPLQTTLKETADGAPISPLGSTHVDARSVPPPTLMIDRAPPPSVVTPMRVGHKPTSSGMGLPLVAVALGALVLVGGGVYAFSSSAGSSAQKSSPTATSPFSSAASAPIVANEPAPSLAIAAPPTPVASEPVPPSAAPPAVTVARKVALPRASAAPSAVPAPAASPTAYEPTRDSRR